MHGFPLQESDGERYTPFIWLSKAGWAGMNALVVGAKMSVLEEGMVV